MLSQITWFQVTEVLLAILAWRWLHSLYTRPAAIVQAASYRPFCNVSHLVYMWRVFFHEDFRTPLLHEAHKKHSVIALTPKHLSFSSTAAIQDIYGHSSPCDKGDWYVLAAGKRYHILNTPDRLEHRIKRKRLAAAFATKNLLMWEGKVVDKVERLVTQIEHHCNSIKYIQHSTQVGRAGDGCYHTMDMRKWFNLFTVEAIADIAFSQNLGVLESGKDTVPTLTKAGERHSTDFIDADHGGGRSICPWIFADSSMYHLMIWSYSLLSPWMKQRRADAENYSDFIRWIVHERCQRERSGDGQKLDDFMSSLLQNGANGHNESMGNEELLAEAGIIMDAGSDTTAIALTHVLWQLIRNPEKMSNLRKELTPYFEDDQGQSGPEIPSYTKLSQCAYLRACLDESLRLYPPLSAGLQRKPQPGGAVIDGIYVPESINVSVSAYVAHRDPSIFPDPEAFIPERWLPKIGDDASLQRKIISNFIPFSTGSRGCIGRNITYIEQTLLVAVLVHKYDFYLPSMWTMEWEERVNLWPKDLPVAIHRRTC